MELPEVAYKTSHEHIMTQDAETEAETVCYDRSRISTNEMHLGRVGQRRLWGQRRLTRKSCRNCVQNPTQLRPRSDAIACEFRRNCVKISRNCAVLCRNCVGAACDLRREHRARALCVRAQCVARRCAVRCASVRRIAVARRELPVAGGRGRRQWTPRRPPVPIICAAAAKAPRWSPKPARGARTGTAPARSPGTWTASTRPPNTSPPGAAQRRGRTPSATCSGRCASGARGPQARRAPREAGHPQMA